ncbi:MAG: Holliday junction branch migration protein RuvA [Candidatus Paceibacterota bacterium]
MISMLRGKVAEVGGNHAVIDAGGVGYKVFMTADSLTHLRLETENKLWIHNAVREDALDLYGFMTKGDRDFFELLLTVSGIGPKSALNILSLVSAETLSGAIRTGQTAHLVKVSGIGKKTAEKILLELKDKLGTVTGESMSMTADMSSDLDVIEALKALGYESDESREALKKIDKQIVDTGAKVKAALKILSR